MKSFLRGLYTKPHHVMYLVLSGLFLVRKKNRKKRLARPFSSYITTRNLPLLNNYRAYFTPNEQLIDHRSSLSPIGSENVMTVKNRYNLIGDKIMKEFSISVDI